MKTQKGEILFYIIGIIAALAALAAAISAWNSYTTGLIAQGDKTGYGRAKTEYTERDNKKLQDTLAELALLQTAKAKLEKESGERVDLISKKLKEKTDEAATLAHTNRLLTGSRGVRNEAFVTTCPTVGNQGTATPASAGTAERDGVTACDLSAGTKQSLREIGLRADRTAQTLAACQALVLENIRTCNSAQ